MTDTSNIHFSSASNEWYTPDWLYQRINSEFSFDLDAAATSQSAKCPRFYSEQDDALAQNWGERGTTVWLNPPYGRLISRFVAKAYEECETNPEMTVVLLIPARVDTKWWHAYCAKGEVRFLKGRVKFTGQTDEVGKAITNSAPFPSALVVFGGAARKGSTSYVEYKEKST